MSNALHDHEDAMSCAISTYRRPDRLQPGDPVPALQLVQLETGEITSLDQPRDRPHVLFFGSYTWPPFRRQVGELQEMFDSFKDRADFNVVYIAEAHAVDGWQVSSNEAEGIEIEQPTTFDARLDAARLCADNLGLTIPTLVDGIDDAACEAFSAWPERIYIADGGRIHYRGGPGPGEFNPAEARASLIELLETASGSRLR